MFYNLPDIPYGKGGFDGSGGGGRRFGRGGGSPLRITDTAPCFQIRKAEGTKMIDDTVDLGQCR